MDSSQVKDEISYLESLEMWKGAKHKGLGPVSQVAQKLGSPQDQIKTVHVTGTNGKGSTSVMIASILGQAGLSVGLFSSPHIEKVSERIVIDGVQIDDLNLATSISAVRRAGNAARQELSYFEVICLGAFETFKRLGVDYGVIEVGLGGMKDATNIITRPEVSVVTSVALDHQHILGDTKEKIAFDKAHIIKPGSKAVLGNIEPSPLNTIIEYSGKQGVAPSIFGRDYGVEVAERSLNYYSDTAKSLTISPGLAGRFQVFNAAAAMRACELIGISDKFLGQGVSQAFWPARLERIGVEGRELIFDCAHNLGAFTEIVTYLSDNNLRCDILFGAIESKNWKEMLEVVREYIRNWSLLEPEFERAVKGEEIADHLSCLGISSSNYGANYTDAIEKQIMHSDKSDLPLLVIGSIYMVAKVRSAVLGSVPPLWTKAEVDKSSKCINI